MGYNSKEIKVSPAPKAPAKPKDVIYDPAGQYNHPGEITKIPSGEITMKGIPYPVLGVDNLGNSQMMMPGLEYVFPGSSVIEYPQLKKGGLVKGTSKNVKTSINELMKRNQDLFGPKGKRYYIPGFPDGGPITGKPVQGNAAMNWQVPVLNIDPQPTKTYPPGQSPEELKKAAQDKYIEENKNIQGWIRETYYDNESGTNKTEMRPIPLGQPIPVNGTFVPKQYYDTAQSKYGGPKKKHGGEAFPQQPTMAQFFSRGFVPNSPVGFYKHGGQPCFDCGGNVFQQGGGTSYVDPTFMPPVIDPENQLLNDETMQIPLNFQGKSYHYSPVTALNEEEQYYKTLGDRFKNVFAPNQAPRVTYAFEDGGWIQKATDSIKQRGTEGRCSGSNFGGPDCPKGSPQYNLAVTFRNMAKNNKKQLGGVPDDILNQEDYVDIYKNTFMDVIRDNTATSIADEAAQQVNSMMVAQFGGMPMNEYGFNPNMMNQDMFAQKAQSLQQQQKQAGQNFYNATMDSAFTANPWMDWSVPTAQMGMQTGWYPTPNQQQQWNYHPQGMGNLPMNYNPYMAWNVRGPQNYSQGYPVPTMMMNPQNTYLQSYDYRGRLLGPGARKISMTFRTYVDPVTGQVTQAPVPDTTPTPKQGSYLTPEERRKRDQLGKGIGIGARIQNFGQSMEERLSNVTPYAGDLPVTTPQGVYNPGIEVPVTPVDNWWNMPQLPQQRKGGAKYQMGAEVPMMGTFPDYSMPNQQAPANNYNVNPIMLDQNTNPANNNPLVSMNNTQPTYYDTTITGRRRMGLDSEASANWILAAISGATSVLNQKDAAATDEEMQRMTLADNQFQAMPANRIQNQGRYNWTGMSNGMMDANSMGIIQQPGQNYLNEDMAFSKYGGAYQAGGPIELSEDEINYIMANGGSVKYLD